MKVVHPVSTLTMILVAAFTQLRSCYIPHLLVTLPAHSSATVCISILKKVNKKYKNKKIQKYKNTKIKKSKGPVIKYVYWGGGG